MNLVKIVELADLEGLDEKVVIDQFNELLNQEPPKEIVKTHPIAKNVRYIPIDKIETLLTKLFQDWYVEVLREGQLLNSVYTTVRLHYLHPIHKQWRHQDGVGAVPIKTKKDHDASDMAAILNDAIMTGLPASKSYAIKDAAEHLGKLFGRDINRKDTIGFSGEYRKSADEQKQELRKKTEEELHEDS